LDGGVVGGDDDEKREAKRGGMREGDGRTTRLKIEGARLSIVRVRSKETKWSCRKKQCAGRKRGLARGCDWSTAFHPFH
jgi:hypothetical protein